MVVDPNHDTLVVLVADDGSTYGVARGVTLLGTEPEPHPDDGPVHLLQIPDGTRSLSKTHAELRYAAGMLILTDLESARGTSVLRVWGEMIRLGNRKGIDIYEGDTIHFAERWCRVEKGPQRDSGGGGASAPTDSFAAPGSERPQPAAADGGAPAAPEEAPPEPASPLAQDVPFAAESEPPTKAWRAPPPPSAVDEIPPPPVLVPVTDVPAGGVPSLVGAPPPQKKPIPKGKEGREIRKVKRQQMRLRNQAAGKQRGGRLLAAAAVVVVLAAGALAVYQLFWDSDRVSALPRVPASVDVPAWEQAVDGWADASLSDGDDIYVTSSTTDGDATLYRLDGGAGAEVWSAEIGEGIAVAEAVTDGHVLVSLRAEDGSRTLHIVDDAGEVDAWDDAPDHNTIQVVDGAVLLVSARSVAVADLAGGDVETVDGDVVLVRGDLVIALREGAVYGYRARSLGLEFGPIALPSGTSVDFGRDGTIYTVDGDEVVVTGSDGERVALLQPGVGDVEVVIAASADRVVAVTDEGAFVIVAAGDDAGEVVFGLDARPSVLDIDGRSYLLGPGDDGGEMSVRVLPGGTELLSAAFNEYVPAAEHLVVRTDVSLDAYSLDDGSRAWSFPIDAATPSIVDRALVTTFYDPEQDETTLTVYR